MSIVLVSIDTDEFGTFSGERPRVLSPISALRAKCDSASRASDLNLIVASEGSFGPHPSILFVPADEELLMLKDYENDIEIVARVISTETNFHSSEVFSEKDLLEFVEMVKFPSHSVILRGKSSNEVAFKGINDQRELLSCFNQLMDQGIGVIAETDMRAIHNPLRMQVIESCCLELIRKIHSVCEICATPGFDVTEVIAGLPCQQCGTPTSSPLVNIFCCKKCGHTMEKKFPMGKVCEDPMHCDVCNP